jgi:phosphoribosylanthranilate isomerase
VWVKICGITCVDDALQAAEAGADAIGINLIESSRRSVNAELAREITGQLRGRIHLVGIVADLTFDALVELRTQTGVDRLQLHGAETPGLVSRLVPDVYKVIHIAGPGDVLRARAFPGEMLLVDTKVDGELGGTGASFDWSLVRDLASKRRLVLAGGLTPDNVRSAIAQVKPWGVDVASGTEMPGNPRRKDHEKVRRFVRAAKAIDS